MTDYASRLRIPVDGLPRVEFRAESGVILAHGYERVVIGERGPYVEFTAAQLFPFQFTFVTEHYYYDELRSIPDGLKCYRQKRPVTYADYRPGMFYLSPFDLFVEGKRVIEKLASPQLPLLSTGGSHDA